MAVSGGAHSFSMQTIIVSDVHLGSPFCLYGLFLRFLDQLPSDAELVLNGDTVDYCNRALPATHSQALMRLSEASVHHHIVWIEGNHDAQFHMDDPGRIDFWDSYSVGSRLHVTHGDRFDNLRPRNRLFITCVRWLHAMRIRLGAEPVHVAFYAKKFPLLYGVLRRHVAANAVEYAKENGYEVMVTGHTHYPEDVTRGGIRLFNTGSWTERPVYALYVDDRGMRLVNVETGKTWGDGEGDVDG